LCVVGVHLGAQASHSSLKLMLASVIIGLSAQRRRLYSLEHEMNDLGAIPWREAQLFIAERLR
jgi:hypothetical protein